MSAQAGIGILILGLIFCLAAFAAWTSGEPSPSSLFAQRQEVLVLESSVIKGRQNGSLRHLPLVTVEWAGRPHELQGLRESFYSYREDAAQKAIRGYRAGKTATVRVANDRPIADRNDWFQIAVATWLSIFALILVAVGIALIAPAARSPDHTKA